MKITLYAVVKVELEVDENHERFKNTTDYADDVAAEVYPDIAHVFSAPPDAGYKVIATAIRNLLADEPVNPLEDQ